MITLRCIKYLCTNVECSAVEWSARGNRSLYFSLFDLNFIKVAIAKERRTNVNFAFGHSQLEWLVGSHIWKQVKGPELRTDIRRATKAILFTHTAPFREWVSVCSLGLNQPTNQPSKRPTDRRLCSGWRRERGSQTRSEVKSTESEEVSRIVGWVKLVELFHLYAHIDIHVHIYIYAPC